MGQLEKKIPGQFPAPSKSMSRRRQRLAGLDPDRNKPKNIVKRKKETARAKRRKRKRYIWAYGRTKRPKLPSSFIESLTPFSTSFLPFFLGITGKIRRRKFGRMG